MKEEECTQLVFLRELIAKKVARLGEDDPIVKLMRQQEAEMVEELNSPDQEQDQQTYFMTVNMSLKGKE